MNLALPGEGICARDLSHGEQYRGERPDRSPGWAASEAGLRSDAGATAEGRRRVG